MRKVLFVFSMLIALLGFAQSEKSNEKLNVLFIIADDLTATAVSSYGNMASQTPHIDQLAREGTRYTRTYSQYPVCGPVSYTHLRAHETDSYLVCRLLLEKKKKKIR